VTVRNETWADGLEFWIMASYTVHFDFLKLTFPLKITTLWLEILKGGDHSGDIGVDGRIILKCV
jgi:hypothetical protein